MAAFSRLRQVVAHLSGSEHAPNAAPSEVRTFSITSGPSYPELTSETVGGLLNRQSRVFADNRAITCSWTQSQLSYRELHQRSRALAKGLISLGLTKGDHVGIVSGNCTEYVEIIMATGILGLPLVVLNTNYTSKEIENAIDQTKCRLFFGSAFNGRQSMVPLLEQLCTHPNSTTISNDCFLQHVVVLRQGPEKLDDRLISYESLLEDTGRISDAQLQKAESLVSPDDVCSLQFTSGTTGSPKVAMLTHSGLINNAIGSGVRMKITQDDVLCCVVPLFHCFGLVLGVLMSLAYGSTLSLPSENFSTTRALQAITEEKCTLIYGVPTMHNAYMQELHKQPPGTYDLSSLRVAITGGAATPSKLFRDIRDVLGIPHIIHAMGMTECSPVTFLTTVDDTFEITSTTAGKVMPHVTAKVVDANDNTVPIGERGELLIAGYNSFRGYWQNPEKTKEVLHRDVNGVLWLRTGDEVTIDEQGYCRVTGRIKDIIIRGGENIFPAEIEERIVQHPSVLQASVVGIKDSYHGEVVAAFVEQDPESKDSRPSTSELSKWVGETLARHKVPTYIWWIGDNDVCPALPQTASGKVQKMVLRDIGLRLTGQ